MTGSRVGEPQIMHARAKRKRSWAAVLTGKTEGTLACLRGDVNGGAEKEKGSRTSREDHDPCFFGQPAALLCSACPDASIRRYYTM